MFRHFMPTPKRPVTCRYADSRQSIILTEPESFIPTNIPPPPPPHPTDVLLRRPLSSKDRQPIVKGFIHTPFSFSTPYPNSSAAAANSSKQI